MKRLAIAALALVAGSVLLAGCSHKNSTVAAATKDQNENTARLLASQPPAQVSFSDERANLNERTVRFSDPNKISYIYLLALDGTPVTHYTVKGKVSSVSSDVNPPEQSICDGHHCSVVVPAPEPDGSYSDNGAGIFFFTTQGAYVEWDGNYLLSDQPLSITAPVKLVVNASAPITASKHASDWTKEHTQKGG